MDDTVEKYFKFTVMYNDALKKRGTGWLSPKDMGAVLLGVPLSEQSEDEEDE